MANFNDDGGQGGVKQNDRDAPVQVEEQSDQRQQRDAPV